MRRRGFTLIELSIALAIVAVMFAGAVMSIGALTGTKAKAAAAELGGTIRSLYDTASLSGKTCRLVFEMPEPRDDESPTKYWAECASGSVTARKDRDDELKDAAHDAEDKRRGKSDEEDRRFRSFSGSGEPTLQDLLAVEKERVEGAAKFAQFTSPEIEPHELPSSVKVSVWTRHQREMARSGTAYLYFFPQGYTERAQVWVRQGDNTWTLTISPLTGKTKIHNEDLEVPRT